MIMRVVVHIPLETSASLLNDVCLTHARALTLPMDSDFTGENATCALKKKKKQTYFETLLKKVVCCEPTQKPGFTVFKTPEIFTAFSMQGSPGVKIKPLSPGASSSLSSSGAAGVNGDCQD